LNLPPHFEFLAQNIWRRYFDLWRQNLEIMSFGELGGGGGAKPNPLGNFGIGVGKKYSGHPSDAGSRIRMCPAMN